MAAWRATCQLIRRYPHTVLVPLVCLAVLITLGCVGIKHAITQSTQQSRERALWEGKVAAESLQADALRAVIPILQIGAIIQRDPNVPRVLDIWDMYSRAMWEGAPTSVNSMLIAYQGVQDRVISTRTPESEYADGTDFLDPNLGLRDLALAGIGERAINMQGPYMIYEYWMTFAMPVFIKNTTENETWGLTRNATGCPPGLCWDPKTNTKFWGLACMVFSLQKLVLNNIAIKPLQQVHKSQFWKTNERDPNGPRIVVSADGTTQPQPEDAVCVPFNMMQQEWQLCLWDDQWAPSYLRWMNIAVVLGALVISGLVCAVLLAWSENRALLHSLLPKEAIDRIRAESQWTKSAYVDENFRTIKFDTPAQHMLGIIATCLSGSLPEIPPLLAVRESLHRSADVYRPTTEAMQTQMAHAEYLDAEVRTALVAQLFSQGPECSQDRESPLMLADSDTPALVNHLSSHMSFLRPNPVPIDPLRVVHENRTASSGSTPTRLPPMAITTISGPHPTVSESYLNPYRHGLMLAHPAVPLPGIEPLRTVLQQLMLDEHVQHEPDCVEVRMGGCMDGRTSTLQRMTGAHSSPAHLSAQGIVFSGERTIPLHQGKRYHSPKHSSDHSDRSDRSDRSDHSGHPDRSSGEEMRSLPMRPLEELQPGLMLSIAGGQSTRHTLGQRVSSPMLPLAGRAAVLARAALLDPASCPQQQQLLQKHWRPRGLMTEVEVVLATADNWEFDAYALEHATNGHPLSVLGFWLLSRTDLIHWAHMDHVKLARFLQHVEAGYRAENPYHNARHAADVLQSMHILMHRGGMAPGYVDRATMLACYIAAIIHDYQHKGRNNDFLVNSYDDLALLYNDRSPMENHHLAAAFALLKRPELACLSGLNKAEWNKLRKLVIDLILATDMKQHFAVVGQFEAQHSSDSSLEPNSPRSGPSMTAQGKPTNGPASPHTNTHILTPSSDNDKLLSLQMALKCADLGHLTAPLDTHLRWVRHLEQEFFLQGDAEQAAGLPISPLCDRSKEGMTKSQVGFIDFVVLPLFRSFVSRFKAAAPLLKAVQRNQCYWLARDGRGGSFDRPPGSGIRASIDSVQSNV